MSRRPPRRQLNNWVVGVVVGIMILAGALIYILAPSHPNSPERNKAIEAQAFREHNLTRCNQIVGPSYTFGPTDAEIHLPEAAARDLCRHNIETGQPPILGGG